jgi:hypothetical protein
MKQKSPFVKYSEEQIAKAEATRYVISMGNDFFSLDGKYTFSKSKAESYHDHVIDGLLEIIETGTDPEIEEAEFCLFNLKILSFKLH